MHQCLNITVIRLWYIRCLLSFAMENWSHGMSSRGWMVNSGVFFSFPERVTELETVI